MRRNTIRNYIKYLLNRLLRGYFSTRKSHCPHVIIYLAFDQRY